MIRLAVALAWASVVSAWPAHFYIVDAVLPKGATGSGLWRPSRDQAIAARATLRRYLISPPADLSGWDREAARRIAERFDTYLLQAEGVRAPGPREDVGTEGDGPKQIHLDDFFAGAISNLGSRVMQRQVVVFDGGECIFHARYDLASGQIVAFSVNGVA